MKHEKLSQALNELDDKYIAEATQKKRPVFRWTAAVAAVLAVVILVTTLGRPTAPSMEGTPTLPSTEADPTSPPISVDHGVQLQYLVAKPEYPKLCSYPVTAEAGDYNDWWEDQRKFYNQPDGYAASLTPFWEDLLTTLMEDTEGNTVYSPVNIYMALSMLAQITDGDSRQQILDVLHADSMDDLVTQAKHVWEAHYKNDGLSTCILATSLWLEENYGFNQETADLLAKNFYASVFQGDLGSMEMNEALRAWLDEQTGGLLQNQLANLSITPQSVLTLASTIYYKVQWVDKFHEKFNTQATFHGAKGDTEETFMNSTLLYGPYYWSDSFGAVCLALEDGSRMWLILPDEGVDPSEIWGEVQRFINKASADPEAFENKKRVIVHLSVPKFDIDGQQDLVKALQAMGITDVFNKSADFSPILPQADGGYITQVNHAARVAIDEKGVTAAAFTVIDRCGAAPPPEDEIYFTLDRPFLFYVESGDSLPLFAGIVNEP